MNNTAEKPAQNAQSISKEPLIIGIGASAGGFLTICRPTAG